MIRVQELCKSIQQRQILTNLSWDLAAGDRFALLGVNGSGKTLLLKILATLVKPTTGVVEIAGYDAFANLNRVRPLIGYVPQTFDGYPDLSVREYLDFFASAYKIDRALRAAGMKDVLDLMDLTALRNQKIEQLSLGQKRRLCLAKTFLHDPPIWFLDETLSALDARGQIEMQALINELGAMGKTVILGTNRLTDVVTTCNRLGILDKGSFALYGDVTDIAGQITQSHRIEIDVIEGIDKAEALLKSRSNLTSFEVTEAKILIESQITDTEIANLLKDLIHAGATILRFQKTERWLEDLFIDVTLPATSDKSI
jgi:ABC-2 type transport system ATP-binding protein